MVALGLGLDPMIYLKAEPFEELVLRKVLDVASEEAGKRKTAEIEAIGAVVAREVARLFA